MRNSAVNREVERRAVGARLAAGDDFADAGSGIRHGIGISEDLFDIRGNNLIENLDRTASSRRFEL